MQLRIRFGLPACSRHLDLLLPQQVGNAVRWSQPKCRTARQTCSGDADVGAGGYLERLMSEDGTPMDPTLEIVWQQDATAILFVRDADGALSAGELTLGKPTVAKLALGGDSFPARRLDVPQLIRLADAPPAEPVAGGSARAIFALVELAQRSVAEGLVHPDLDHGGGWWHAFWGATLDQSVQATLTEIAAALPAVSADAFDGDRDAHGARPLSRARRPDREGPPARRRGAACEPDEAGSPDRARPLPRRAHAPPTLCCRATPATRRSTGSCRAGSTPASVDARRPAGGSACTSTSGKATRSCSSCGCRPRTIRRSGCPRPCCGAATTTSSPSSATAIRAGT